MLPVISTSDDLRYQHSICGRALAGLLNIGNDLWIVAKHNPGLVNDKLGEKGLESSRGKGTAEIRASVEAFLSNLKEEAAVPFAMRSDREVTGRTTRHDVEEVVLPLLS